MPTVARHTMRAFLVGLGIAVAVWTTGGAALYVAYQFMMPKLVVIK